MKKVLLVAFIVAMASLGAQAEWLYWKVDDSSYLKENYSGEYAVGLFINGSAVSYYNDLPKGAAYTELPSTVNNNTTFYVEVYTYENSNIGSSVGHSETLTYQQLSEMNAISFSEGWTQSTLGQSLAVWNATNVVPEPTSGLLTMIGLALLGLKRRRV